MAQFYYPIKLHYSQTFVGVFLLLGEFYYPIKLHYSQTVKLKRLNCSRFYYPIKLHYSQTMPEALNVEGAVLLPHKITLLSNFTSFL